MHVDLLIITALKDELDALCALHGEWAEERDEFGLPYRHILLPNHAGHLLRLVAAWSGEMGEAQAATRSTALVTQFKPNALAMWHLRGQEG